MEFLSLPLLFTENLPLVWTFLLLVTRFTALLMLVPGLGMGPQGMAIRLPAILVLAFAALTNSPIAAVPPDGAIMAAQLVSEAMLGGLLGVVPVMLVAGLQTGAQLASTSMGLGASQLIDPSFGIAASDLSRIYGDIAIIMFLMIGGHHVVVHAAAGMGGMIVPGTFIVGETSVRLLIDRSSHIFELGLLLSAPVIVALLLTQFVMGLISRAVPTVNIFIISFPLTIGIGLIISLLALPDVMKVMWREIAGIERTVQVVAEDTELVPKPAPGRSIGGTRTSGEQIPVGSVAPSAQR